MGSGFRFKHLFHNARKGKKSIKKVPTGVKEYVHKALKKEEGKTNVVSNTYNIDSVYCLPTAPQNITFLLNPGFSALPSTGFVDTSMNYAGVSPSATGYMELNKLPRLNDYMKMVAVHIKGQIGYRVNDGTLTIPQVPVRFILYVDKMCKGLRPNVNQVLDQSDSTWSVYNTSQVDFPKRFKVLYDKTIVPPFTASTLNNSSSTGQIFTFEIKKKLSFVTAYNRNASGTYQDIDTNQLCLGLVSEDNGTYGAPQILTYINMNVNMEVEPATGRGIRKI